jgi:SAM-dependent methyltransferase
MASRMGWNWSDVPDADWSVPSEDVYYFLYRWRERELLRVLDLGCGIGRHSLLFAEHGYRVTAVDLSDSGLKRLRTAAQDKRVSVATTIADVTALPFDEGCFDAILAYHSIYHVDTAGMVSAIAEARRVLRPGGEIYMSLISKANSSFTGTECKVVDANVRLKREVEGTVLPHFYVDHNDIPVLLAAFTILRTRHVEDIYDDGSSWHYFVHAMKPANQEAVRRVGGSGADGSGG